MSPTQTVTKTFELMTRFNDWFNEAKQHEAIKEPTAMSLATVAKTGLPSVRIVLLKEVNEKGFVFYTNLESRKSAEIKQTGSVALCFYWMPLDKQIRIEGNVEPIEEAEADAYFSSRVREKQIGAWASAQSSVMESRDALNQKIAELEKQFEGQEVPRPAHWSGWRVVPEKIEFWEQRDFRLHEREVFTRADGDAWESVLLYP